MIKCVGNDNVLEMIKCVGNDKVCWKSSKSVEKRNEVQSREICGANLHYPREVNSEYTLKKTLGGSPPDGSYQKKSSVLPQATVINAPDLLQP